MPRRRGPGLPLLIAAFRCFAAEIWKLYMEQALAKAPVVDFPEPSKWPTWKPFHRGPYALSYDPNATTTAETATTPSSTVTARVGGRTLTRP